MKPNTAPPPTLYIPFTKEEASQLLLFLQEWKYYAPPRGIPKKVEQQKKFVKEFKKAIKQMDRLGF